MELRAPYPSQPGPHTCIASVRLGDGGLDSAAPLWRLGPSSPSSARASSPARDADCEAEHRAPEHHYSQQHGCNDRDLGDARGEHPQPDPEVAHCPRAVITADRAPRLIELATNAANDASPAAVATFRPWWPAFVTSTCCRLPTDCLPWSGRGEAPAVVVPRPP